MNENSCFYRKALPIRSGSFQMLQRTNCQCQDPFNYQCKPNICSRDENACDGYLFNLEINKTLPLKAKSCKNGKIILF